MSDQNIEGLNKHLFDQLDRLSNAGLQGDDLRNEIERSKAISSVSKDVISSTKLSLDAARLQHEIGTPVKMPRMLAIGPRVPR